jgi:hypothetical protein
VQKDPFFARFSSKSIRKQRFSHEIGSKTSCFCLDFGQICLKLRQYETAGNIFCHAEERSIFYALQVADLPILEDPSLSLRMTKRMLNQSTQT